MERTTFSPPGKPDVPAPPVIGKLEQRWNEIHDDWEANVTYIYGRKRFHRIWDVVAHSILTFNFKGRPVTRGWVEAIIAGDTKCGKSEVAEKMSAFLGIAKPVLCESASLAGILGGVKDVGGKFAIQWGALARADKRMLVLDEVTGLTVEQIGQLSGVRSSGIAQLVKIEAERAPARVRKLWISNPRTDRNRRVTTYPFGVQVIPEIIGRAEDISRFDVGLVASSEEVPLELLNAKSPPVVPHRYTAASAQALLMWAWTRKLDQVVWEAGVEDLVLDQAIAMSGSYSSQVPLVEPGEQRYRIARIAVALAARFHSTDPTGQLCVVKAEHVELARTFLDDCYCSPVTGYAAFSVAKRESEASLKPEDLEGMVTALEGFPNMDVVLEAVAFSEDMTRLNVVDYQSQAKLIATLARLGLLDYGEQGRLYKSKKFSEFYRAAKGRFGAAAKERF